MAGLRAALEALGGQRQQLRHGRQVPVGGDGFAVAQVGGQPRQQGADVDAGPVPAEQGAHREGVAQVMDPGPAPAEPAPRPLAAMTRRNVCPEVRVDHRVPAVDTKNAGVVGCGQAGRAARA